MDKKLMQEQRDGIVKNVIDPIKHGMNFGNTKEIIDWLNENTCTEHVLDSILCCIHCGIERPGIEKETKQGEFLGYFPDGEPVGYADVEEEGCETYIVHPQQEPYKKMLDDIGKVE